MCGIFGIIANDNVVFRLISGLKHLEYRGYDSSGISIISDGNIKTIKKSGKITELEKEISSLNGNIGIAHSRWATHGKPTEINAHPHNSCDGTVSVVHNGIIENYATLKEELIKLGYHFKSETDTEVISNLIAYYLKIEKDFKKAIFKSLKKLKGTFGIAIIFKDNDSCIYCAKRGCPLIIGLGENVNYISSGLSAFSELTNKIVSLEENDVAEITTTNYIIYNGSSKIVNRTMDIINIDNINVNKGNFEHFMLKEIYEEPEVIKQTISEYIDIKNKKIILPHLNVNLKEIEGLNIISCGTSYYASFIAKYFIEKVAKIKVNIDIASEFRYKNFISSSNEVFMFISQSGETADTIGALQLCKENKQKIVSIVNVEQSNIAHLSDGVLKTFAGPEIGVASTKALVGQLVVLYLFGLEIAKNKNTIAQKEYETYIDNLLNLPNILQTFLKSSLNTNNIIQIAEKIKDNNFFMFIGRNIYYPIALEGALKLKEVSYIPCEGISAGELKHGPIALIDKNSYIFAINPTFDLFEKTSSNIEEIVAREGKIILISDKNGLNILKNKATFSIEIEKNENSMISAISCLLPIQLLAYYIALKRGNNIDKPRNLAKSVTVE